MRSVVINTILSLSCLGCGRTEQKVELKSGVSSEVKDPNCKKGQCTAIEYSLVDGSGVSLSGKTFEGVVLAKVEWPVKVKSSAPAGRIKLALTEKPEWLEKKDTGTPGSIIITGTPKSQVESNTVKILARDISRCAALEKQVKSCSDTGTKFPDYDKIFTLTYTIK